MPLEEIGFKGVFEDQITAKARALLTTTGALQKAIANLSKTKVQDPFSGKILGKEAVANLRQAVEVAKLATSSTNAYGRALNAAAAAAGNLTSNSTAAFRAGQMLRATGGAPLTAGLATARTQQAFLAESRTGAVGNIPSAVNAAAAAQMKNLQQSTLQYAAAANLAGQNQVKFAKGLSGLTLSGVTANTTLSRVTTAALGTTTGMNTLENSLKNVLGRF